MKTTSAFINYIIITMVILSIFFFASGRCQDEDEDDEDIYDEELGDETTTTRRSRVSASTTVRSSASSGRNGSEANTTIRAGGVEGTTRASAATPASAPAPASTRRTTTERATTLSEYEDDEEGTTEEEGYGYVFRPLNKLIDNIVAGNVTGIVDNALSIRTPPEIRAFVNNVMSNVFSSGIGTALKQFMPQLFTTQATPTLSPGRDPIPTQVSPVQVVVQQQPIPISIQPLPVLTARTNGTEDVKAAKNQQPLQLAFTHPGAPASRLRCEVIA